MTSCGVLHCKAVVFWILSLLQATQGVACKRAEAGSRQVCKKVLLVRCSVGWWGRSSPFMRLSA